MYEKNRYLQGPYAPDYPVSNVSIYFSVTRSDWSFDARMYGWLDYRKVSNSSAKMHGSNRPDVWMEAKEKTKQKKRNGNQQRHEVCYR